MLTVVGGFGGGAVPVGSVVQVWADVDPHTALATWSGAVDRLSTPDEWNAALTMPDEDVTLTVTLSTIDAPLEARTYPLAAGTRDVLIAASPAPVGVVLFFHGAAYAVDQLRDAAARTVTNHLHRAGYTVVALESEAEASNGTGGWNAALTSNPDLDNVRALVDALRVDGTLPAGAPVFAWGMSSGGMFAHTVGAALPTQGVVASCAAGTSEALAATTAPTGWYLAGNDQTFPTAVAQAEGFQRELATRSVVTDLYVHPPTPLYDARFQRVEGVDASRSARIVAALRDQGSVDDEGAWLVTGSSVLSTLDALDGLDGLDAAQQTAVAAEIEISAADHELYDDAAARMVAFLDALR